MSSYAAQRADYVTPRFNMVEAQVRTDDVTDSRIINAMLAIARERFMPPAKRAMAYADRCIEVAPKRYLLDPRSLAKLIQLAAVQAQDKVLDIGCATGYSSAVLGRLAAHVVALEHDVVLAHAAMEALKQEGTDNIVVVQGPLVKGAPLQAPYDVIFINGAVEMLPQALFDQLHADGRLIAVNCQGAVGHAHLYLKREGALSDRAAFDADIPVLPGFEKVLGFVF